MGDSQSKEELAAQQTRADLAAKEAALKKEQEKAEKLARELEKMKLLEEKDKELKRKEEEVQKLKDNALDIQIKILEKENLKQKDFNNKIMDNQVRSSKDIMEMQQTMFKAFQDSLQKFFLFANEKPENTIQNRKGDIQEMIRRAQRKYNLNVTDFFNFAFAGHVKTGKSTLINAIRGISKEHPNAAKVDVIECTRDIAPYTFPEGKYPYVKFYDTPGSGTASFNAEDHYDNNGLCAFDCLIILIQNTLAMDEMEFARKALEYGQPVAFVRSRCDETLRELYEEEVLFKQFHADHVMKHLKVAFQKEIDMKAPELRDVPLFFVSSRVLTKLVNERFNDIDYKFGEENLLEFIILKSKYSRNIGL